MHTTGRRRRRRHSAQFKAEAVAACRQPGVSLASVALSLGLNANLLRRWVAAAERSGMAVVSPAVRALSAPVAEDLFSAESIGATKAQVGRTADSWLLCRENAMVPEAGIEPACL